MPVAALFEHLDHGSTIDEFLEWFPAVSREQVHEVLAFAKSSLQQPSAADSHRQPLTPVALAPRLKDYLLHIRSFLESGPVGVR